MNRNKKNITLKDNQDFLYCVPHLVDREAVLIFYVSHRQSGTCHGYVGNSDHPCIINGLIVEHFKWLKNR